MLLSDFDFELPPVLIAQSPLENRDASRLLRLHPDGTLEHRSFSEIVDVLSPGDLVIANNSRVYPARVFAETETGGHVELLVLERVDEAAFWALARPAKKVRLHSKLFFREPPDESSAPTVGIVEDVGSQGRRLIRIDLREPLDRWLDRVGTTPLPPYIKEPAANEAFTRKRYQTVYANERGSIACPTAGLHFTSQLLERLKARGIEWMELTLHVGYATFQPIRDDDLDNHRMGFETYVIEPELAVAIETARQRRSKVVAIGTTTVRALESYALQRVETSKTERFVGRTDLFIRPGFRFQLVDALLTNFHLPKSSLLVLVSSLGGRDAVLSAYREAVSNDYRFYSYGDAMLLYPARAGADCANIANTE